MDVGNARLCYLGASRVLGPTGVLAALDVRTMHNQSLGSLDGVVIDPAERRLRFFVVEPSGSVNHRRILLPVEAAASVAPEGGTLRIELESGEIEALDEFDMADFREFTEEDAIAPTLSRYLA
ncbi:MAG: PRC-barrel domain-containing protein [Vicinamibacterales bacterium]